MTDGYFPEAPTSALRPVERVTQADINDWARRAFGDPPPLDAFDRRVPNVVPPARAILDAAGDVVMSAARGRYPVEIGLAAATVVVQLYRLAGRLGLDLDELVAERMRLYRTDAASRGNVRPVCLHVNGCRYRTNGAGACKLRCGDARLDPAAAVTSAESIADDGPPAAA